MVSYSRIRAQVQHRVELAVAQSGETSQRYMAGPPTSQRNAENVRLVTISGRARMLRATNRGMRARCGLLVTIGSVFALVLGVAIPGHADPSDAPGGSPFPELSRITRWYTQLQPDEFFISDNQPVVGDTTGDHYVWFLSPSGLNCGIWFWGSFGCAGNIPGAPPGDNHIAWYNGNRAVHHGWTAATQFPPGQAQRLLPPRSYVTYNSTTCATTPDNNTYCGHGDFQFLITQTGTSFKGWDDRRSYVCNSYGTCPPG
jgi:hypothetical protein